jgi:gliding motility-associated-like protein
MKKILLPLFALVMLASSPAFSQGGDDCAAAMAAPITLPFTQLGGGTCTGIDDYNGVGVSCGVSGYTTGPDWLYYFTAPTNGQIQIGLTNMTPQYPWSSISIWQGCPNTGTCLAGTTTTTNGLDQYLTFTVTANQSYFIMIDNWPTPACFNYDITIAYMVPPPIQPSCTNMDFETGDFTGWYGTIGQVTCGVTNAPHPVYNQVSIGAPSAQHTIMTGPGLDPCGNFPVVCPGGTFSVRLGEVQISGNGAGSLEQSFQVTPTNANFTYRYAVVVEDATHLSNEQPWFQVEMWDQNNNLINCGQYLVVGGPNIPGFFAAGCGANTYYRPWTTVNVDLTAYVNQPVTIKFTVGDCCYGGHFGYAYIDCTCMPMQISGNDTACTGQPLTLTAPSGSGTYLWSPGNQTTQSIVVSPTTMTIYTCTMSSITNPNCVTMVTDTVFVTPSPVADFGYLNANCSLLMQFLDSSSISSGNITGWQWYFGDNTTDNTQNPQHTYPNSGTYTVSLVVTASSGCQDSMALIITVQDSVIARFDGDTVCQGFATNFFDNSINTTAWTWNFGDPGSGIINNNSVLQNPTHVFSTSGVFNVTLITSTPGGCPDTLVKQILVNPLPGANFNATPNPVTSFDPLVTFTDLSTGNPVTWFWDFGDPPATSVIQNPQHQYPENPNPSPVTYRVMLIVTNQFGCVDTTYQDILVNPEYTFYAPNCVTPDGNGTNEMFYTYGVGWKDYHLMIFDRWGDLIWQTKEVDEGWDCKVSGKSNLVQEDVYVWKVVITDIFDKKHHYIGHVTVVR